MGRSDKAPGALNQWSVSRRGSSARKPGPSSVNKGVYQSVGGADSAQGWGRGFIEDEDGWPKKFRMGPRPGQIQVGVGAGADVRPGWLAQEFALGRFRLGCFRLRLKLVPF